MNTNPQSRHDAGVTLRIPHVAMLTEEPEASNEPLGPRISSSPDEIPTPLIKTVPLATVCVDATVPSCTYFPVPFWPTIKLPPTVSVAPLIVTVAGANKPMCIFPVTVRFPLMLKVSFSKT